MSNPPTPPHKFSPAAFIGMAMPMIVSRAGLAAMSIADGVMVSRYDTRSFAFLSLADGTLGRLLDICIAFLIGGLSLVPRHVARGDAAGAKLFWLRTVPVSLALGAAGCAIGLFGRALLPLLGQTPELSSGAAPIMAILGAGYPAALLAISAAVYLEGVGRPGFVAVSIVTANVLNVVLNWVLIGGHFGLPAMGASGSAISTTAVRCALGIALGLYAWRTPVATSTATDDPHADERRASERSQWHLGFGAAGTVAAMVVLTSSLTLFAGRLGVIPLAVFAATWSLAAPVALIALGMADAAGIYVSAESGRSGNRAAAAVSTASLSLTLATIGPIAIALALFAATFAGLYTGDAEVRQAISASIPLVAVIVAVDSVGFVMSSSLRAVRDVAWPAGIEIGSMVLLVPVAAGLALARGMGVRGLFVAMLVAGVVRASLLAARFHARTRSTLLPSVAQVKVGV